LDNLLKLTLVNIEVYSGLHRLPSPTSELHCQPLSSIEFLRRLRPTKTSQFLDSFIWCHNEQEEVVNGALEKQSLDTVPVHPSPEIEVAEVETKEIARGKSILRQLTSNLRNLKGKSTRSLGR
jgi:hypothetical protein